VNDYAFKIPGWDNPEHILMLQDASPALSGIQADFTLSRIACSQIFFCRWSVVTMVSTCNETGPYTVRAESVSLDSPLARHELTSFATSTNQCVSWRVNKLSCRFISLSSSSELIVTYLYTSYRRVKLSPSHLSGSYISCSDDKYVVSQCFR
jgi:hypothetical protein